MKNANKPRVAAVILAAGRGERMYSNETKQKMLISGETVLLRSVRAFCECNAVDQVLVVTRADELDFVKNELKDVGNKYIGSVVGGSTRAESSAIGFRAVADGFDVVAIHDAARCLVTPAMIERVIGAVKITGAATAAARITDTVKRVDENSVITETVPREGLWSAQTPQAFTTEIYRAGLAAAERSGLDITDDNMLAELAGKKVIAVDTGKENIKITVPEDLRMAELILTLRDRREV